MSLLINILRSFWYFHVSEGIKHRSDVWGKIVFTCCETITTFFSNALEFHWHVEQGESPCHFATWYHSYGASARCKLTKKWFLFRFLILIWYFLPALIFSSSFSHGMMAKRVLGECVELWRYRQAPAIESIIGDFPRPSVKQYHASWSEVLIILAVIHFNLGRFAHSGYHWRQLSCENLSFSGILHIAGKTS